MTESGEEDADSKSSQISDSNTLAGLILRDPNRFVNVQMLPVFRALAGLASQAEEEAKFQAQAESDPRIGNASKKFGDNPLVAGLKDSEMFGFSDNSAAAKGTMIF